MNLVEWSYNTSLHSSRGMTPCEVTYNKPSPSIPGYILDSSPNEGVDFGTLPLYFTTFKDATMFLDLVYKQHGKPSAEV